MSDPKGWTSRQLASALDGMVVTGPNEFGTAAAMSMLDEATFSFRRLSPEVAKTQEEFGRARYDFKREQGSPGPAWPGCWADAVRAAGRLAAALRDLGDVRVVRCEKRGHSRDVCGMPLGPDGACGYLHEGEEA